MTYTVKNGTWCKDNNKEYYSTTKTGLKAALAAGEITSGTKVVIHEPQYHAGQLIQSLNPECPEGCFVPHGQAFDTSIYTELAKLFPDGNLPDMRECVMVCAGRSERTEITNHDEYTAGQFKDDQFAEHNHSFTPSGSVTSTFTGTAGTVNVSGGNHRHIYNVFTNAAQPHGMGSPDYTQQGINSYTSYSGDLSMSGTFTPSGSVGSTFTGDEGATSVAGAADKVTHGKQFGVYYYIAF